MSVLLVCYLTRAKITLYNDYGFLWRLPLAQGGGGGNGDSKVLAAAELTDPAAREGGGGASGMYNVTLTTHIIYYCTPLHDTLLTKHYATLPKQHINLPAQLLHVPKPQSFNAMWSRTSICTCASTFHEVARFVANCNTIKLVRPFVPLYVAPPLQPSLTQWFSTAGGWAFSCESCTTSP